MPLVVVLVCAATERQNRATKDGIMIFSMVVKGMILSYLVALYIKLIKTGLAKSNTKVLKYILLCMTVYLFW